MLIKLMWVREKNEWHMLDDTDSFLQEFFDCMNMHRFFKDLDKDNINLFRVDITKVNH